MLERQATVQADPFAAFSGRVQAVRA